MKGSQSTRSPRREMASRWGCINQEGMEIRRLYRAGDTVIAAAGVRGMCPHLLRTPRSRSPRRCPWTPGACRPRSPRILPLRRSPCTFLCTDSGISALVRTGHSACSMRCRGMSVQMQVSARCKYSNRSGPCSYRRGSLCMSPWQRK